MAVDPVPLLILLLGPGPALQDPAALDPPAVGREEPEAPAEIVPREWLVIRAVDRRGRRPFRPDAVFARNLLDPASPPPEAGQVLVGETGREQAWEARQMPEEGRLEGRAGWAYAALEQEQAGIWMADLQGAATLFVNGAGFAGDYYGGVSQGVPVALRQGVNHLYVTGIRGGFRLRLYQPGGKLLFAPWGATTPDLVAGWEQEPGHAGALVINASLEPVPLLHVVAGGTGPFERKRALLEEGLGPLGMVAIPLPLEPREDHRPPAEPETQQLRVSLGGHPAEEARDHWLPIGMRQGGETWKRTFLSEVDGSVQYYGVVPPDPGGRESRPPHRGRTGLVLTLHGAGVQGIGQARCYGRKPDFWIVAPTNRRPFGFDWQDWGRADAYEALEDALRWTGASRERIYLTGHSMGGHGVWHLAANDPDTWAAIAPSAGWVSFDAYGGRPPGAGRWDELWRAADASSDTLSLVSNLARIPTYILHGEKDDNVPVRHAEIMRTALTEAGAEPLVHIQEGAGHWWGNQCVDWPGIFEHFAGHSKGAIPEEFEFTTVDPAVDSRHYTIEVLQPLEYGRRARVRLRFDLGEGVARVETENVRKIRVRRHPSGVFAAIELDGKEFRPCSEGVFTRAGSGWTRVPEATEGKGPGRSGPFKRAFDRRFALIVGTAGTEEETRTLYERARHDAQVWWYRANGRAPVVSDEEVLRSPRRFDGRNLVLYGNSDTNAAWWRAFGEGGPIQATREAIKVGDERFGGDDLAAVFVRPRQDDPEALAGAFASTGIAGARLGYTLSWFVSGVGYPDYAVFSSRILRDPDAGVLAAGWFDHFWRLP